MGIKIVQQVVSKQPDVSPREIKGSRASGLTGREFQTSKGVIQTLSSKHASTPSVRPTQSTVLTSNEITNIIGGSLSIAPLLSPTMPIIVSGHRVVEHIHGWGARSVCFLDVAFELGIFFAARTKWTFGAGRGRWIAMANQRFKLSVDGVLQGPQELP